MKNYRLLARLDSRTTDNRNAADMVGYVATVVLPKRETNQCTHWR